MDAPTHITYHKFARTLELQWDQERYELPAELLRVYSPSADVRGHSPDRRTLQTGKKNVGINLIEPVGNYAIRIGFDDGHGSGIYAWAYLHELGSQKERFWHEYLQELKQANASRLPNIPVRQW